MKIQPQTLDGENPYRDEVTELRLDRISQRLTLLSVLLPIAIVAILILGYLDLKHRVAGLQDSGTANIQSLSDDLSSRFATLSVRVAELEENVQQALADSRGRGQDLVTRLTKLEENLKRLESQKTAIDELKAATAVLDKQIAPLAERISAQDQAIKAAGERVDSQTKTAADAVKALEAEMAALSEELKPIREDSAALEAEVKNMASTLKADREATQKAIAHQKEAVAKQLGEAVGPLEQRLKTLDRKIDRLQRDLTAVAVPVKPSSPASPAKIPEPPASPQPPTAAPPPTAADQLSLPDLKPGQIIEKPLQ